MAKKTRGMVLALSTMLMTAGMSVSASSADSMKIRLTTDGQSTYYQTIDKTVGEFFKTNKLAYDENYKISADPDTVLTDGMQITVVSPKKITVSAKGGSKKFTVETQCETIGQLMLELKKNTGVGYKTAEGRSSSEKLKDGDTIELREVKEEIYTETEEVPFSRVEEKTEDLYEGETKVVQQGVNGKKLITMKTIFYDDVQVDNYCIERKVVAEPINEKVLIGTKKKDGSGTLDFGKDLGSIKYSRAVTMNATAYCPCAACNGSWAGQPSTMGLRVQHGIVAVDPKFIPLGTKLYVEGYGYAIAADTGGAIKGNRIDLCYNSHSEALSSGWGHTNVKVYILE